MQLLAIGLVYSMSTLSDTIRSLIDGLSEEERSEALIVLMVAEPYDVNYSNKVHADVRKSFQDHLDSGLLEVITPHASFYPKMDNLKVSLRLAITLHATLY